MTEAIDISALNFQQLDELRNRVEHRVMEMRETGASALRERWTDEAAAIGMTIESILQAGKKRGRGNGGKHHEAEAKGEVGEMRGCELRPRRSAERMIAYDNVTHRRTGPAPPLAVTVDNN